MDLIQEVRQALNLIDKHRQPRSSCTQTFKAFLNFVADQRRLSEIPVIGVFLEEVHAPRLLSVSKKFLDQMRLPNASGPKEKARLALS